tara:strand:- start:165 stop:428 length:264 start_codon:yes stop_codon:yes gene_type:complete
MHFRPRDVIDFYREFWNVCSEAKNRVKESNLGYPKYPYLIVVMTILVLLFSPDVYLMIVLKICLALCAGWPIMRLGYYLIATKRVIR